MKMFVGCQKNIGKPQKKKGYEKKSDTLLR